MNPYLTGELVNGGLITRKKSLLQLEYNCIRKGESWVQLSIPLLYFRDINLFFVKECPHQFFGEFLDFSKHIGFIAIFILASFFVCIGTTLYNIVYQNKTGVDSVPYLISFLRWLISFPSFRSSGLGEFIIKECLEK